MRSIQDDWYNYPQYCDIAFQTNTKLEADFIEAAGREFSGKSPETILETGCGTGRLILEMARRGYDMHGLDLSQPSLKFLRQRLKRAKLNAKIVRADMTRFQFVQQFDVIVNTLNTFRHLITEADALRHLTCVLEHLRPGGLFALSLHLFPPDADDEEQERWTEKRGKTVVTTTLRVLSLSRRKRLERLRFSMRVRNPSTDLRVRTEVELRLYSAQQIKSLIRKIPQFELCGVYDFWYDINEPLPLNNDLEDTVILLRKRTH